MIGLAGFPSSALARALVRALRFCGFGKWYVPKGNGEMMDSWPFAGNVYTTDPKRYARVADIIRSRPALGIGSPTNGWMAAANDAMHEFEEARYGSPIHDRTLIVASGADRIASTPASKALAERSGRITHIVVEGAEHEVLIEQDGLRAQFWSAFDKFAG
jgi:lysophospholipase